MAKTILGIDIGYDTMKLALVTNGVVRKAVSVSLPQNLVQDGRPVSPETMGELIHKTMKDNGLRAQKAAYVLPSETVYIRSVVMPQMTADQLIINIPYEFNDYITDELRNYVFDYAMETVPDSGTSGAVASEETESGEGSMELMAVAAPKELIEEASSMLRKAGLKLVKVAPALCSYISLIRKMDGVDPVNPREYCILDLGYKAIQMYMFRGDRHMTTRVLEVGLHTLDSVIGDAYNVDVHLAHTYLLSNYDNCQNSESCLNAYSNIAVELMRALNFYQFSNPDSQLSDVWLCGGGAQIAPLREAVASTLNMTVHPAEELVPGGEFLEECNRFVQAVGITLD